MYFVALYFLDKDYDSVWACAKASCVDRNTRSEAVTYNTRLYHEIVNQKSLWDEDDARYGTTLQ